MRRARPRLWLSSLFVVAYLALAWLIYQQLTGTPSSGALARIEPPMPPLSEDLPPQLQYDAPPLQDFENVLNRPLFSPTRRPAPGAENLEAEIKDFAYTLKGVLIDDESRIALFHHNENATILRQPEGSTIGGWLLKDVEPDFVVLERGGEEQVMELLFRSQPARLSTEE